MELRHLQSSVPQGKGVQSSSEIECIINEEYSVSCRKEDSDVFLPFSFVSKYFEVRSGFTEVFFVCGIFVVFFRCTAS